MTVLLEPRGLSSVEDGSTGLHCDGWSNLAESDGFSPSLAPGPAPEEESSSPERGIPSNGEPG